MKRVVILIFVLMFLFVNIKNASAASIEMKNEYKQGETIIAKISGSFFDTIQTSNVLFYRNHVQIPMEFDIKKINDTYYIWASLVGKTQNNYSIKIENVRYYQAGQLIDDDIIKNFTVTNDTAYFSVKPGFVISSSDFSIDITNLVDNTINVEINTFNSLSSLSSESVAAGTIKSLSFGVSNINENTFGNIKISYSGLEYILPVLVYGQAPQSPLCGNNIINSGEDCDGTNLSGESCNSLDYNSGTLKCKADCTFDVSSCLNKSQAKSCIFTFQCNDDEICDNGICVQVECKKDSDCNSNEECTDNECVDKEEDECRYDRDCDSWERCDNGECILEEKDECGIFDPCPSSEECIRGTCVPKDINQCDSCKSDEECLSGICVKKNQTIDPVTQKTCNELGGRICCAKETCSGDSQAIRGNICCLDECVSQGTSSSSKIIGWSLLIIILGFIFWFYFKYKRTKKKKSEISDLLKKRN